MKLIQVDTNLWRGSRPETALDFAGLKDLNIKTVLNLEYGFFEFFHGKANYEAKVCTQMDMIPLHLKQSDFTPPSYLSIVIALDFMALGNCFVHCLAGVDRTGVMCAAYRVKHQGFSIDEAIDEMQALGFHWWYKWWLPSIRNNLKLLLT